MASNVTLLSMRTQARQRADMVNSNFVSDSELNGFINGSIKRLYNKLVLAGEFYYTASQDYTLSTNQAEYDLPANFFKCLGVDYLVDQQGNTVPLKRFEWNERSKYLYGITSNPPYLRYCIFGNKLIFRPIPNSGLGPVRLTYAPTFVDLSADNSTFDGINGWEEWVILDAAKTMLMKEESDVSALLIELAEMSKEIDSLKVMRDIGQPGRIEDVSGNDPEQMYPFAVSPF